MDAPADDGFIEETPAMIRYLALGDSYTIGESISEDERWPVRLVALLRGAGFLMSDPHILARTGWTTGELAAAIEQTEFEPEYELVSVLIGVNNQYRGYDLEPYREEFADLLKRAIAFAGGEPGHVLVLSIPDWGMTPFAGNDRRTAETITTEIAAFNAINREETLRLGAVYIDIFPISQGAYADPDLIAADGLHPSAAQYELWAEAALPAAMGILGEQPGH
jgi:lysophospholipase L1-like esterase